jgi:hypothetical protein
VLGSAFVEAADLRGTLAGELHDRIGPGAQPPDGRPAVRLNSAGHGLALDVPGGRPSATTVPVTSARITPRCST